MAQHSRFRGQKTKKRSSTGRACRSRAALGLLATLAWITPAALRATEGHGAMKAVVVDPKSLPPGKSSLGGSHPVQPPADVDFDLLFDHDADSWEQRCIADAGGNDCELSGGLDHVVAGTALRNSGHGTISLRGVPFGGRAVAAWLMWATLEHEDNLPGAREVQFEGQSLLGTMVRSCLQPCWIEAEPAPLPDPGTTHDPDLHYNGDLSMWHGMQLRLYVAPVLDRLQAGVNGDYRLSQCASSVNDGRNPWLEETVGSIFAEGASLVVAYSHGRVPREARTSVHTGPAYLFQHLTVKHVYGGQIPAGADFHHSRIAAGGQTHYFDQPIYPYITLIGDEQETWTRIRGPGSAFDPRPDFEGRDGAPVTQLWDSSSSRFTLAPEFVVESGVYRVRYQIDPVGAPTTRVATDCVGVVAHVLTTWSPDL